MARARILHLPCSYLPWITGGKETYTHALTRQLDLLGYESHVAFHQNRFKNEPLGEHAWEGTPVSVLPPLEFDRAATYACRTKNVPGFESLLDKLKPAIVHFHDFSSGANLLHLELARQRGIRTVMTYHSPGQSCLQRELLFEGKTPCDGQILLDRCTGCRLGVQNVNPVLKWFFSKISLPMTGESSLARACTARTMTALFRESWKELVEKIDLFHIYAEWVREMFLLNEVPEAKLRFFRTGLPFSLSPTSRGINSDISSGVAPGLKSRGLNVVMLGRCDRIKGQKVVIEAVKKLPTNLPITIHFIGPYWDTTRYGQECLNLIEGDPRFAPIRSIPHTEVPAAIQAADALLVPSLWLETGPLVVLEGFSQGKPIIGSRLGGIAELVQDEVDGLLFTPGDSSDLAAKLQRLCYESALLRKLQSQVKPPRTMRHVAEDYDKLYRSLLPITP